MAHVFHCDTEKLREYATQLWLGEGLAPQYCATDSVDDFTDEMIMLAGACLIAAYKRYDDEQQQRKGDVNPEKATQFMLDLHGAAAFCGGVISMEDDPFGQSPLVEVHCEEFRCSPPRYVDSQEE